MATATIQEPTRRDFMYIATGAVGTVGVASFVWPLISQMSPDKSTLAAGAPAEFDISKIAEGQVIVIKWRGAPWFVRHRSEKEIADAKANDDKITLDHWLGKDVDRIKAFNKKPMEQWIVVAANCTHLGCIPIANAGEFGGWYCPCHGSQYDNAGRVRRGPAPWNLGVPQYEFVAEAKIRIFEMPVRG
jgi:ubiquinol-cytochrome c reductase iron-sulfur subunit